MINRIVILICILSAGVCVLSGCGSHTVSDTNKLESLKDYLSQKNEAISQIRVNLSEWSNKNEKLRIDNIRADNMRSGGGAIPRKVAYGAMITIENGENSDSIILEKEDIKCLLKEFDDLLYWIDTYSGGDKKATDKLIYAHNDLKLNVTATLFDKQDMGLVISSDNAVFAIAGKDEVKKIVKSTYDALKFLIDDIAASEKSELNPKDQSQKKLKDGK